MVPFCEDFSLSLSLSLSLYKNTQDVGYCHERGRKSKAQVGRVSFSRVTSGSSCETSRWMKASHHHWSLNGRNTQLRPHFRLISFATAAFTALSQSSPLPSDAGPQAITSCSRRTMEFAVTTRVERFHWAFLIWRVAAGLTKLLLPSCVSRRA